MFVLHQKSINSFNPLPFHLCWGLGKPTWSKKGTYRPPQTLNPHQLINYIKIKTCLQGFFFFQFYGLLTNYYLGLDDFLEGKGGGQNIEGLPRVGNGTRLRLVSSCDLASTNYSTK